MTSIVERLDRGHMGYVHARLRDRNDVDDVLQTIRLYLLNRERRNDLPAFSTLQDEAKWIQKVIRHKLIDFKKTRSKKTKACRTQISDEEMRRFGEMVETRDDRIHSILSATIKPTLLTRWAMNDDLSVAERKAVSREVIRLRRKLNRA